MGTDAQVTATEHTNRLFKLAALSDDDRGYPSNVSFVSYDTPGWPEITMRNLRSGQPTVLITAEGLEYLLLPHRRSGPLRILDLLRHRERTEVYWRHDDHTHGGFETSVSRDTLGHLERPPKFA